MEFILHETVHKFHEKKLNGVIVKIDFEKPMAKSCDLTFTRLRMEHSLKSGDP
jgi:hypothetical protein